MGKITITIKNVSREAAELLRDIRLDERRQLSAIFEDCLHAYIDQLAEYEEAV